MLLNRIEPGTVCTSRKTGETGKVNRIFFYPTKYEVEFSDGRIEHYSSKDLEFEGIEQKQVSLKLPEVPDKGIGESWCEWVPFNSESFIEHHFLTSKEIMWKTLTSLEMYNVWFHGIQRALPEVDSDRFVHKYSFSKLELKPGVYFKIRPMTIAPWFRCRVMTYEKEKEFGFTFQTTPLSVEFVHFSMSESDRGIWVRCSRRSEGLFSILDQLNWQEKSKILQKLDQIIPKTQSEDPDIGNVDQIGVQSTTSAAPQATGGFESLSREDQVAYLVNKALDGDMDAINNFQDKVIRAKAKAMMVKIKRGSVERPAVPNIDAIPNVKSQSNEESESDEQKIKRLAAKGLEGDMDEINALDNKVVRGKIKAAIIKAKRASR